jgi:segregation and condensation protein A
VWAITEDDRVAESEDTISMHDAAPAADWSGSGRCSYEVRLVAFEGPLDLLLHLIRENRVNIYDIPIAQITQQYVEYITFMESLDLSLAGDFLEMAATLIRIKVQMLLPPPIEEGEDEEDPRNQLVRKLVEYKKFKEAALSLSHSEEERRASFPRGVDPKAYADLADESLDTEEFLRDVTLFDLVDALREVLSRVPQRIDVHTVGIEQLTVEEQMDWIRTTVRERGQVIFRNLFADRPTRMQVVTTFIALLELIRLGIIAVAQERVFGEIVLSARTEV